MFFDFHYACWLNIIAVEGSVEVFKHPISNKAETITIFIFKWKLDSCSKAYNYILKLPSNKKTQIEVKFKISSKKGTS